MNALEKISSFSADFDPGRVSERMRRGCAVTLLDTYAVAVAGVNEPAFVAARKYVSALDAQALYAATLWGESTVCPAEFAALVNGIAAHVLDYDDVVGVLRGHPSVVLWPALAALAEAEDAGTDRLASAYVVGFEVMMKLARAYAMPHYAAGWHTTASIGIIGATAACAHLLELDAVQAGHAIGLAVAQAGGVRQNVGTQAKSFQAGQANAAAVRSVLLARAGFESSPEALDGQFGYFVLYAQDREAGAMLDELGTLPLEFERCGVDIKKYPMCYATHRALDAVLDLLREREIRFSDVASVDIRASYAALVPLIHPFPRKGLEGKFSMQYGIAAALLDGGVRLGSFTDAAVQRADIAALMPRINVAEAQGPATPRWAEVTVRMKDGSSHVQRTEALRGSSVAPLSDAELIEKVQDCLDWAGRADDAKRLHAAAMTLGEGKSRAYFNRLRVKQAGAPTGI
ncbi:MAG: MmgE/PrpD family protein [Burkholderiaceae bacterium]